MVEENISQKFRLKSINETKNYFFEEIEQNELIKRKHKNVCTSLNYIEHTSLFQVLKLLDVFQLLLLLLGIPTGITSSAIGLIICAISAIIRNCKSIIKKTKKKHDKILLLPKSKLNNIEVLISKALTDSNINHDEFVLTNNVLKEYNVIKEKIKNLKT